MNTLENFLQEDNDAPSIEDRLSEIRNKFYQMVSNRENVDASPASRINEEIVKNCIQKSFIQDGLDAWFEISQRNDVQMKYDLVIKAKGINPIFRCVPIYFYSQVKSTGKLLDTTRKAGKKNIKKGVYCFDKVTLKSVRDKYNEIDFFCFFIDVNDESDVKAYSYSVFFITKTDLIKLLERQKAYCLNLDTNDPFWIERNGNFDVVRNVIIKRWEAMVSILVKTYGQEKIVEILEQDDAMSQFTEIYENADYIKFILNFNESFGKRLGNG